MVWDQVGGWRTVARVVVAILGMVTGLVAGARPAAAAVILNVTTIADVVDGGDGVLSWREAILQASAQTEPATIVLAQDATYTMATCGSALIPFHAALTVKGRGSTIQGCSTDLLKPATGTGIGYDGPRLEVHDLTVGHFATGIAVEATGGGVVAVELDHVALTANRGNAGLALLGPTTATIVDSDVSDNGSLTGAGGLAATGIVSSTNDVHVSLLRTHVDRNTEGVRNGSTMCTCSVHAVDSSISGNGVPDESIRAGVISREVVGVRSSFSDNVGGSVTGRRVELVDSHVDRPRERAPFYSWAVAAADLSVHGGSMVGNGSRKVVGIILASTSAAPPAEATVSGVAITGFGTGIIVSDDTFDAPIDLTVENATISGNGSGVHVLDRGASVDVVVRDSSVVDNAPPAGEEGGGIRVATEGPKDGSLRIERSTVAGNSAGTGPAGDVVVDQTLATPVTIDRSIVGTPGGSGGKPSCLVESPVVSVGRSVGDGSCGVGSGPGDVVGDARLGPLGLHGGSTPTRVPALGSPAVDRALVGAAGCGTSGWPADQRGVARPEGVGCDSGAVEARYGGFHPVVPARIFDTRDGDASKLGPGASRTVEVAGRGSVPSHGVSAVVVNATVTNTDHDSHLSVYPAGGATGPPMVSNLNWVAGATVANLVTVPITPASGSFLVRNNEGSAHVIVDVAGWYDDGGADGPGVGESGSSTAGGAGFSSLPSPVRVFDTRDGTGTSSSKIGAGAQRSVTVAGASGVPGDASAVVVNVTGVLPTEGTHLTVWPAGQAEPVVSNVNLPAGAVAANVAVVKVGSGGKLLVRNNSGKTDVVVDLVGWYATGTGARFRPIAPDRVLATIDGGPVAGRVGPGVVREVDLAGRLGGSGGATIVANLTGVNVDPAPTHITAAAMQSPFPTSTSSLNLGPSAVRANAVFVRTNPAGVIGLRNNSGRVHLILDLAGWFG